MGDAEKIKGKVLGGFAKNVKAYSGNIESAGLRGKMKNDLLNKIR